METIDDVLRAYDTWDQERVELSESDYSDHGATWDSDDFAVELLHRLVNALRADIP